MGKTLPRPLLNVIPKDAFNATRRSEVLLFNIVNVYTEFVLQCVCQLVDILKMHFLYLHLYLC